MALSKRYNPLSWYWVIGGSTTQVWSSATLSLIASSDSTYVTWHIANNPSAISSAGQLVQVMFQQVKPHILSIGIPVTSSGTSALNASYDASPIGLNRLALITALIGNSSGLPGGVGTFSYPDVTGNYHSFTPTNILNLAAGLSTFVYNWEQAIITRSGGGSASLPTSVAIA